MATELEQRVNLLEQVVTEMGAIFCAGATPDQLQAMRELERQWNRELKTLTTTTETVK